PLHRPVGDGADLPVGLPLADHKVVGHRGLVADVEDDRVPRLLLGSRGAQQTRELQRRESPPRFSGQSTDYEESAEGIAFGSLAPMQRILRRRLLRYSLTNAPCVRCVARRLL